VGTVRILYRASTIRLQAAVYPEHTLGALNMKEKELILSDISVTYITVLTFPLLLMR